MLPPHPAPDASIAARTACDGNADELAQEVYLAGNKLPEAWRGRKNFVVLDTGFGRGLNFLLTWHAWRSDPQRSQRLHYLAVEKQLCGADDLTKIQWGTPQLAELVGQLHAVWPEPTRGFHQLELEAGACTLTLAIGDGMACIPQFVAELDAIYLNDDNGAPSGQHTPQLLKEIALLSRPGTRFATPTHDAGLRDALTRAGFSTTVQPGLAPGSTILTGELGGAAPIFLCPKEIPVGQVVTDASPRTVNTTDRSEPCDRRDCIVVGAGLAGCLIAEAMTRQGFDVRLFERNAAPAEETSGNKTAVMLPMLSLDDNRASRLNRACYLHALRSIALWRAEGLSIDGEVCGVLQIGRDAVHVDKQREILARCKFPESYVQFVDTEAASQLAGYPVSGPGWWFAGGAWWNPPSLCAAALTRAGHRITARWSTAIERIEEADGLWSLFDSSGTRLGTTRHLILASAHDLLRLPQTAHLPLFKFRGQVTHLYAPDNVPLRAVVCKEGYVSPVWQGQHCVGASFHRGGEPALRESDHQANLERLQSMLPGYLAGHLPGIDPARLDGRVAFRPVSPDKLPMVGQMYRPDATPQGRDLSAVERWQGLYVASGYGARGLVWSGLMAELLACQIAGAPLPLESDLAATVDPARFLLRRKD